MNLITLRRPHFFLLILFLFSSNIFSQCFEIQSILVDACDGTAEGLNEMVRFKIGSTPLTTAALSVTWPNGGISWKGLIQNSTTSAIVAQLNADIILAGGCGQIVEPSLGVLPADATVILVTSNGMSTAANPFGPISDTIYMIFQNSTVPTGHFANFGPAPGARTLTMTFGAGCLDTVTYDRTQLTDTNGNKIAADGATVNFTPAGVASYINSGCKAPVPPFSVDAGPLNLTVCAGTTITLNGTALGQQSVAWSSPSGSFSSPTTTTTDYTIPPAAGGSTIVLTLQATNSCGLQITDVINLSVSTNSTPDFATTLTLCSTDPAPVLATTSPNGVTGTWNPAVINTTTSGNYIFTPTVGLCATTATLAVTITTATIPDFATTLTLCSSDTAPVLAATSPNGITGTWNPAVINMTNSGSYIFTPTAGLCATTATLTVTITPEVTPDFTTTLTLCSSDTAPILTLTSPNGITGTWNPAVINTTTSGSYIFTPTAGLCATTTTLAVTITPEVIPDFATALTLCSSDTAPVLATTSPNGITGTWNPAVINTTTSGSYIFTPTVGLCATTTTLAVTITPVVIPDFATTLTLCSSDTAPVLAATSPNGITGTWNPAVINMTNSGNYIFTPTAGLCATTATLTVTITPEVIPDFTTTLTLCSSDTAPVLAATSPNGITGTWNPAVINTTTSGSYVFTPTSGLCATTATLAVTITPVVIPDFATTLTLCSSDTAPILAATSPNGVTGRWNPTVINRTNSGSYIFTPNTGQCGTTASLVVTINTATVPDFATTLTLCSTDPAPVLALTSPNGVTGTWNPAVINTTTSGSYVFTPTSGQCGTTATLAVTITTATIPDFATTLTLCTNGIPPALATTSPNGVTGTWNPAVINNSTSGNYIFTPTAGQCATTATLAVNITSLAYTISQDCINNKYLIKAETESSASNYSFNWFNEKGDQIGTNNETFDFTEYSENNKGQLIFPLQFKVIVSNGSCEREEVFEIASNLCGVPNAISPNGDGINDTFDLTDFNVTTLTIYNRWGRKVYDFQGKYDDQWHGQWKEGNMLPTGTYFYTISSENGKQKAGWVFLSY